MREKKKKGLPAYLTVEASFLVPMAFFLLVFIIHMSFYLYGRCILTQDTYLLAFRASILKEGEDRAGYVSETAPAQFKERYFGNTAPEVSASTTEKAVYVKAETSALRKAFDLADTAAWDTQGSTKAAILNAPAHIRRVKRLKDLAEFALQRKGD